MSSLAPIFAIIFIIAASKMGGDGGFNPTAIAIVVIVLLSSIILSPFVGAFLS